MVLCKTPRVSVFGPHTRESLAEAKWTKVNKSGHYVCAPVNSCSLVSLCFKKRGGRCDHEESPCLFFCSHYRGSEGGGPGSPLLPPPSPPTAFSPLSLTLSPLFSFCFLFLSSSLLSSPLLFVLLLSPFLRCSPHTLKIPALPAQCFSNMREGRDQWCPRRENYTAEFR